MATSIEREIKLALDPNVPLPDFSGLGGVVEDRGVVEFDTTYWDTHDLGLLRRQLAVRRREGRGWTLKGPSRVEGLAVVREESEWPDGKNPPAALSTRVCRVVGDVVLEPVARMRVSRHRLDIVDGSGVALVEIDDDCVIVLSGETEVGRFREVEIEITGASDELVAAIVACLGAVGATPDSPPKYLRVLRLLGRDVPAARPFGRE